MSVRKELEKWLKKNCFEEKLGEVVKDIVLTGSYDLAKDCFVYGTAFIQLTWKNGELYIRNLSPKNVLLKE